MKLAPTTLILLLLTTAGLAATSLTACQDINTPNEEYYLQNDVTSNGTCFNINVNDILIDCQGHSITGNGTGYGIQAYIAPGGFYTNVTVKNCVIKNYSIGMGRSFRLAENNTITNFSEYGIYSEEDSNYGTLIANNTVENSSMSSGAYGAIIAAGIIEQNTVNNVTGHEACGIRTLSESTIRYNTITHFGAGSGGTANGLCLFVNGSHHVYNNTLRMLEPGSGVCVNMGNATNVLFENNTVESPGADHSLVYLNGYNITFRNNFFNKTPDGSGIHVDGSQGEGYAVLVENNYFYSGINGSSVLVEGGHDVNITGNRIYSGSLLSAKKGNSSSPAYNVRAWNNTVTGYSYDTDTGLPVATGVYVKENASAEAWNNTFHDLGKAGATNRVVTAALVYYNESRLRFYNNTVLNVTAPGYYGAQCAVLLAPGPSVIENNTLSECGYGTSRYDAGVLLADDTGEVNVTGNSITNPSNNGITLMNATGYSITQLNSSNTFTGVAGNRVERRWVSRIKVENQHATPLSGAHVELNDSTRTNVENSTTSSDGFTPASIFDYDTLMPVQDFISSAGAAGTRTPHNVSASWHNYYNDTQFTANSSLQGSYVTVVLWVNETYVQSCSNLDSPAVIYVLNESILDSNASQCMNITANDTVLRCEPGVVLEGNYSTNAGKAVVLGNGSGNSFQGIMVRDCTIRGWGEGIYSTGNDIQDLRIINVTIQNVTNGIRLQNGTYSDLNITSVTVENYSSKGVECSDAPVGVCWNAVLSGLAMTGGNAGADSVYLLQSSCTLASGLDTDGGVILAANQTAEYTNITTSEGGVYVYARNASNVNVTGAVIKGGPKFFAYDGSTITVSSFTVNSTQDDVLVELSGGVTLENGVAYDGFDQGPAVGVQFDDTGNAIRNVSIAYTGTSPGGVLYGVYDVGGNTIHNVTVTGWDGGASYTGYGYYYDGSAGQSSSISQAFYRDNEYDNYVTGGSVSLAALTLKGASPLQDTVISTGELYNIQTRPAVDPPVDPSGWKNISTYWVVENVSGTAHANLTVQYSDTAWQNAGVNESTLTVFEYNGSAWNQRNDTVLNTGTNTVQLYTSQFSGFGVFGYSDTTPPTVVLGSPADGAVINTSSINFTYTPSDDRELDNCRLWTNRTGSWQFDVIDTSPDNGTLNTFQTTGWTNGSYVWNVQCYDQAGNSAFAAANRSFTVGAAAGGAGQQAAGSVTVVSAPGYDLFLVFVLFSVSAAFVAVFRRSLEQA